MAVSNRGIEIASLRKPVGYSRCNDNKYDKDKNPEGILNLGVSENYLVFDLLKEKLGKPEVWNLESYLTNYAPTFGLPDFRKAVAAFLTERTSSVKSIDPEQVALYSSCNAIHNGLGMTLADEGDGILIPTPFYPGIKTSFTKIPRLKIVYVHLSSKMRKGEDHPFQLTVERLEEAYQQATQEGTKVKILLLNNPQNPLGHVYPASLVRQCLEFAHKYSLHVIVNEIYSLSAFDESVKFRSVLSLENIPDSQRTHFIWGFSKDFGLSGFRSGALYTENKEVVQVMAAMEVLHTTSNVAQQALTQLITDRAWLDDVYFPVNRRRLQEAHHLMCQGLERLGVEYVRSPAGLFVWANFQKFLPRVTFEAEWDLYQHLCDCGVHISLGKSFSSTEPGWFRIVFSSPSDFVQLALQRMETALKSFNTSNQALAATGTGDATAGAAASQASHENSLDDLVSTLHKQLMSSDWLEKNTAEQWKQEHPQLYTEYMAAARGKPEDSN